MTTSTTSYSQLDLDIRSDSSVTITGAGSASSTELIHAAEADGLPTSFGVFKPVGYVMTGLPSQAQLDELVSRAQQVIGGVEPQQLRDNAVLRQRVVSQLAGVQSSLDGLLVDRPRRNILRRPQ